MLSRALRLPARTGLLPVGLAWGLLAAGATHAAPSGDAPADASPGLGSAPGILPSTRAVAVAVAAAAARPGPGSDAGPGDAPQRPPGDEAGDAAGDGVGDGVGNAAGGDAQAPRRLPPLPRRSPIFVPQWELGLGISALSLPDYRGSDRSRRYAVPFPYATWRSERFTADRSGLKAELLDRGRLEVDMSLSAAVPVSSRGNAARAGMPRLHPTIEVGPQVVASLWRAGDGTRSLRAQLPLRYVVALSRDMNDAGLTFNPRLVFDVQNVAGYRGWNLGIVAGPMFGSRRHHDFYYSVDSEYATAARPAYRAAGGFGGYQLTLALSKRFPQHWFGAFVRADWLDGATFADSPLVRRRQNVAAGFAFSWIFSQSDKRVPLAR